MKIPGKLKIGGRTYQIIFPHTFKDSIRNLYGLCDDGGQIIYLSEIDTHGNKRHPESIQQTFIHEILHAIDNIYYGGKLTAQKGGEEIIDQLAEGLAQLIRDNDLDFTEGGNDGRENVV
jgi:hypothetical protein